jgi:hypothetical protein
MCGYNLTGNVSGICPECGWLVPSIPWTEEGAIRTNAVLREAAAYKVSADQADEQGKPG